MSLSKTHLFTHSGLYKPLNGADWNIKAENRKEVPGRSVQDKDSSDAASKPG